MDLLKHQDRTVDYLVNLMSHCFGLSLNLMMSWMFLVILCKHLMLKNQ